MTLAALDGDALYQLVVLALLGGGSLLKKFFEAQQARRVVQDAKGPDAFERANRRKREETMDRLAELEEEMDEVIQDPWEEESPSGEVGAPKKVYQELDLDALLRGGRVDLAAATKEVSIEGEALEEFSLEGDSFDAGTASKKPWKPEERIRASVFKDIERSVSEDIIQHVDADMAGGVRGEAKVNKAQVKKVQRAHRGWRDAFIAAEILGSPVSMRDPASQPAGLRGE